MLRRMSKAFVDHQTLAPRCQLELRLVGDPSSRPWTACICPCAKTSTLVSGNQCHSIVQSCSASTRAWTAPCTRGSAKTPRTSHASPSQSCKTHKTIALLTLNQQLNRETRTYTTHLHRTREEEEKKKRTEEEETHTRVSANLATSRAVQRSTACGTCL